MECNKDLQWVIKLTVLYIHIVSVKLYTQKNCKHIRSQNMQKLTYKSLLHKCEHKALRSFLFFFFKSLRHPARGPLSSYTALLPLEPFLGLFQQLIEVEVLKLALGRRRVCISVCIWRKRRTITDSLLSSMTTKSLIHHQMIQP